MAGLEMRDRGWVFDFVLAGAVTLLAVTPMADEPVIAAMSALLCSSLMFRRSLPALGLGLGLLGAVGMLAISAQPVPAIVVVPMLIYGLARWSSGPYGRIALVAGLLGALLGPLVWLGVSGTYQQVVTFGMTALASAAIVLGAYLLGSRRRESRLRERERREAATRQQMLVEAEQAQRAQVATISERARIARELHDIVAHSLSVIVVQADGGRALAAKRPEAALEVFGTIAETSRQALTETRHIVGLLRGEPGPTDPGGYSPTPGLDEVAELVRRTSSAFELSVFGTPPAVSQALGLTVYRIVQESLTNVLKHAGPGASARVTVAYTADGIEIEVTDDGAGAAVPQSPPGHGHEGMRERVAVHGGQLAIGPRIGGGYTVRATLPLDETRVPTTARDESARVVR
jgi:signal transduction histidine kinase